MNSAVTMAPRIGARSDITNITPIAVMMASNTPMKISVFLMSIITNQRLMLRLRLQLRLLMQILAALVQR